jgi:hypothetical protein
MAVKDNQTALKHGGDGAVKRISEGKPFIGLAEDERLAVEAQYKDGGQLPFMEANAIRCQAALNLFWNAVLKAAQDGDLLAFDRYIARYGWLAGVTMRAWADVGKEAKTKGKKNVIDMLKGEGNGG